MNENKKITNGNYDPSLAVKCINGTFVGMKTENVIGYKGIPFVGKQPVGDLRWKVRPTAAYMKPYIFPKLPSRTSRLFRIRVKTACI